MWTEDNHELSAMILAEKENSFAVNLEKLVLKSSNNEISAHIRNNMNKQKNMNFKNKMKELTLKEKMNK